MTGYGKIAVAGGVAIQGMVGHVGPGERIRPAIPPLGHFIHGPAAGVAQSAAFGLGVPLIPVHHVRGHIAANYIAHPDLEPPFLCLCVSGGTTAIVDVKDYTHFEELGSTRDDAAGECFDKTARVLGLGYPGV